MSFWQFLFDFIIVFSAAAAIDVLFILYLRWASAGFSHRTALMSTIVNLLGIVGSYFIITKSLWTIIPDALGIYVGTLVGLQVAKRLEVNAAKININSWELKQIELNYFRRVLHKYPPSEEVPDKVFIDALKYFTKLHPNYTCWLASACETTEKIVFRWAAGLSIPERKRKRFVVNRMLRIHKLPKKPQERRKSQFR